MLLINIVVLLPEFLLKFLVLLFQVICVFLQILIGSVAYHEVPRVVSAACGRRIFSVPSVHSAGVPSRRTYATAPPTPHRSTP